MDYFGPAQLFNQLPDRCPDSEISDDAGSQHSGDDSSNFFGTSGNNGGFTLNPSKPIPQLPKATNGAVSRGAWKTYNLRPGIRDKLKQSVWITFLDDDESGTYNPKRPNAQITEPGDLSNYRDLDVGGYSDNDVDARRTMQPHLEEPRAAHLSRLAAKQQGVSIVVTFDLTTPALRKLATSISDHWPGESHNIISDEHFKKLSDELNSLNGRDGWGPKYNLRRRILEDEPETESWFGTNIPNGAIADPLVGQDDEPFEVDLRWHPVARGCVHCRESQFCCSLLQDCQVWPCKECVLDNLDCHLLVAPISKAACQGCRRRRISCSYVTEGSDPTKPCSSCLKKNLDCYAGPGKDAIRERISYDRDYARERAAEAALKAARIRRSVQCTTCRQRKQRCSLRGLADKAPCTFCQEHGHDCEFRPPKLVRNAREPIPTESKPAEDYIIDIQPENTSHDGSIIVKTSLISPIAFLHDDPKECTWCTENIGIMGRGEFEATLIPSADGLSYTELDPSHNHGGEKMCVDCTMSKMRNLSCEHEFRPLDGIIITKDHVTGEFSINAEHAVQMYERLITKKFLPSDRWCAVCPAPALYQCCTPQDTDMWGEPIDPLSNDAEGCGFLCCEDCSSYLIEFDGDLEKLIEHVKKDKEIWCIGARADVDLLKHDGLLMKNLTAGLGDEPDAMDID